MRVRYVNEKSEVCHDSGAAEWGMDGTPSFVRIRHNRQHDSGSGMSACTLLPLWFISLLIEYILSCQDSTALT